MRSANSPEHKIRIKIGLILLVIVLYFIGLFIFSLTLKNKIDIQKEEMDNAYQVLSYSNELIISVQQAQDALNRYLVSPTRRHQRQYDSISNDIFRQISDIKSLSPERGKDLLLEDIDSLLQEKNKIIHRLTVQFSSQNPLEEVDKKIETYDEIIQDSIVVTTNKDTTVVAAPKKDFWGRLKDLFNPKDAPDSTVTIAHTEKQARSVSRVDTTLYADLKQVTQKASQTYSSQMEGIEREVRELVFAEQNISLRISRLITQFYNEAIEITRQGNDNSEILSRRIITFALSVGAISILLILIIISLIIDDLNKGQKARIDLAREKQLTEELIDSRHKLLLSVSHDIKTPLSSMMGYMEMWDAEELPDDMKRQLHSARNSGLHILSMLNNLLEFSRMESNKTVLHFSRFNLIELMQDIIGMFRPFTDEKALNMRFENLAGSPFFVETDYTVLKQILTNVISNAVKYTLQGSITISLQQDEQLIFTISDTGIGIDKEDLGQIFKPFSRIKNPLKAEGNGFGLYVTKGLVDSLKGEITLSSEKGKGTTVTIRLPIAQMEGPAKDEVITGTASSDKRHQKVLLFEDDASLGNMVREFLMRNGYKVKLCNNTRDVKGFARIISSFDIVFTDMQMGEITGLDILHEIRAKDDNIPVWLMTAYDEYTPESAMKEGFTGLITKPIHMGSLLQILSGEKELKQDEASLSGQFPQLTAMFNGDAGAVKDILSRFIQSSERDREELKELIHENRFKEAQQLCHRIHPFYSQLDAAHISEALRKMDSLRGADEDAWPQWKEELLETIRQMELFAENIRKNFLLR